MDKIIFKVKPKQPSKVIPTNLNETSSDNSKVEHLNVYSSIASVPRKDKPKVIPVDPSRTFETKLRQTADSWDDLERAAINEILEIKPRKPRQNRAPKRTITMDNSEDSNPDEPDYSKVSVDEFGLAMIRGMGWKEGEGVGKTFKTVCPVKEVVLRPHLAGLGVEAATCGDFLPGGTCIVKKGTYKGYYGTLESCRGGQLKVRLSLLGKVVTLSASNVKMVTTDEFNMRNGSVREDSEEEAEEESWLRLNLIVRLNDRNSPHYRARVVIKEIPTAFMCTCALLDGSFIINSVREEDLETVVPDNGEDKVFVVRGEHVGKVGTVEKSDKVMRVASVKLMGGEVVQCKFREVCSISPNPR